MEDIGVFPLGRPAAMLVPTHTGGCAGSSLHQDFSSRYVQLKAVLRVGCLTLCAPYVLMVIYLVK
jgi:hypothetical protein